MIIVTSLAGDAALAMVNLFDFWTCCNSNSLIEQGVNVRYSSDSCLNSNGEERPHRKIFTVRKSQPRALYDVIQAAVGTVLGPHPAWNGHGAVELQASAGPTIGGRPSAATSRRRSACLTSPCHRLRPGLLQPTPERATSSYLSNDHNRELTVANGKAAVAQSISEIDLYPRVGVIEFIHRDATPNECDTRKPLTAHRQSNFGIVLHVVSVDMARDHADGVLEHLGLDCRG